MQEAPADQKDREYKKLAFRQAELQVRADQFKKDNKFTVVEKPGAVYQYLAFNLRKPMLSKVEVRQAIASGLRTTFSYDIELRMVVPTWVDRTIATATVTISDQYDNLTRRYSVTRMVDGRIDRADQEPGEEEVRAEAL